MRQPGTCEALIRFQSQTCPTGACRWVPTLGTGVCDTQHQCRPHLAQVSATLSTSVSGTHYRHFQPVSVPPTTCSGCKSGGFPTEKAENLEPVRIFFKKYLRNLNNLQNKERVRILLQKSFLALFYIENILSFRVSLGSLQTVVYIYIISFFNQKAIFQRIMCNFAAEFKDKQIITQYEKRTTYPQLHL